MRLFRRSRSHGAAPVSQAAEPRDAFVSRVVSGRSFCDVGGLWGTVSEKVSVAHAAGASRLAMMDVQPAGNELWQAFRKRLAELGVESVEEIPGDVMSADGSRRFDVVHCSGVIYHVPSPLEGLAALRRTAVEHLILSSAVVPAEIENEAGSLSFAPGQALFVPHLDEAAAGVLRRHFDDQGITGIQGLNAPAASWELGNFAPWWWLFTPGVLRQMLLVSGFDVVDEAPDWNGNAHVFLARCV